MGTPAESLLTETIQSGKTFVGKAVVAREQVAQDRQLVLGYWLESKVDYHLLGMVLCKKHNRPHTNEENFRISLLRVELKWTPCIQNPCLRRFRSAANHIWVWAVSRTSSHLSCYLCRITWTYLHIALVSSLCTAYSILTPPLFPCWIRFSVFRLPRVNSLTIGARSQWFKFVLKKTHSINNSAPYDLRVEAPRVASHTEFGRCEHWDACPSNSRGLHSGKATSSWWWLFQLRTSAYLRGETDVWTTPQWEWWVQSLE